MKLSFIKKQTRNFIEQQVLPFESQLALADSKAEKDINFLVKEAHKKGLWGQFFPEQWGGNIKRLNDYLTIGLQEGRSEFAPTIFGGLATVDAHMLNDYGSAFIKDTFLKSLSTGDITSAYGMTEPNQPGSIPATLSCQAKREGKTWRIDGEKWFICNATKADYITVLACSEANAPLSNRLTMFVIPIEADGCDLKGPMSIFGRQLGQGHFTFKNVIIDDEYRLGEIGQGLAIMHRRVGLGRLLRSIHWLGLAERCLELSYQRIHSDKGQRTRLGDKQLIRQHIYKSYSTIETAKLLLSKAAKEYDKQNLTTITTNLAKISASKALCQASDSAIQIYGAEGVSDMTPLAAISQVARTTRILDGADEALINSVGHELLKNNHKNFEKVSTSHLLAKEKESEVCL
ncbi:MAG: acyl-CoA dehydrogenase family protein [Cellvibrionaceae bacterium]